MAISALGQALLQSRESSRYQRVGEEILQSEVDNDFVIYCKTKQSLSESMVGFTKWDNFITKYLQIEKTAVHLSH